MIILFFSSCADLFHREIVACFRSRKICVCRWECASFDSFECLSLIFLSQLFCFPRNVYLSWLSSSFWLLGAQLGFYITGFFWAGWRDTPVMAVWRMMGGGHPAWAGDAMASRLPVSRLAPNLFSPPPSGVGGHNIPIWHLLGLFRGQIWHLNVGHIWGNQNFPKFLLWF